MEIRNFEHIENKSIFKLTNIYSEEDDNDSDVFILGHVVYLIAIVVVFIAIQNYDLFKIPVNL